MTASVAELCRKLFHDTGVPAGLPSPVANRDRHTRGPSQLQQGPARPPRAKHGPARPRAATAYQLKDAKKGILALQRPLSEGEAGVAEQWMHWYIALHAPHR